MNFLWEAIYNDGTTLPQYNEKGEVNGYENIDRTRLKSFCMYTCDEDSFAEHETKRLLFKLHLEPGQRLIYRRRVLIDGYTGDLRGYFYMIGWQQKIGGTNTQSISYVYEDGHVEQAGIWAGGEPTLIKTEVDVK